MVIPAQSIGKINWRPESTGEGRAIQRRVLLDTGGNPFNWAIARKCSLSLRGVESRLATLYEKLFVSTPEGTPHEAYEKLAYNVRTRAFFEALRRGLLNNDELEKASVDLEGWLERDQKKFAEEQKREEAKTRKR